MCDFEDMDLYQPRPNNDGWIELQVSPGKSIGEVGEEKIEADDQGDDTNKGGEHAWVHIWCQISHYQL